MTLTYYSEETNESTMYDFMYKGKEYKLEYYYSFNELMLGVRYYFDFNFITLTCSDTDLYNALENVGAVDNIVNEDIVKNYLHKVCENTAYEKFIGLVEEEIRLNEE